MGKDATFQFESREALFPIYLWRFHIDDHAALNRALLIEITDRQANEPGLNNGATRYGWQSERDLFRRREPAHQTLAQAINRIIGQSIEGLWPPGSLADIALIANGWVNINPPGGYNAPHTHPETLISGTYYVSVPAAGANPVGGAIEFNVPHPTLKMAGLPGTPMLAERVQVMPEPGLVLLFPGTLSHWVHPNDSDADRVSISFNAMICPKQALRS